MGGVIIYKMVKSHKFYKSQNIYKSKSQIKYKSQVKVRYKKLGLKLSEQNLQESQRLILVQ